MRAAVALALALAGCAPGTVVLTPDAELAEVTADAASQWVRSGADVVVAPGGWRVRWGLPQGDVASGAVRWEQGDVVVRPGTSGETLRLTVLHELGHLVLGEEHRDGTVMAAVGWSGGVCVDDESARLAGGTRGTCGE